MKVVLEVYNENRGWTHMGDCVEGTAGTLSSEHPTKGRQIYMFGWYNGKGPALWRSVGGVDEEQGFGRLTTSIGYKKLVVLSKNPHVRIIYNPRFGPVRMRFSVAP